MADSSKRTFKLNTLGARTFAPGWMRGTGEAVPNVPKYPAKSSFEREYLAATFSRENLTCTFERGRDA